MYRGWSGEFFAFRGPIKILLESGAVFEMWFVVLGRPWVVKCSRVLGRQVSPFRPTRSTEILHSGTWHRIILHETYFDLHHGWQYRFVMMVFQSRLQNVPLNSKINNSHNLRLWFLSSNVTPLLFICGVILKDRTQIQTLRISSSLST